jgi:hypothetical protein
VLSTSLAKVVATMTAISGERAGDDPFLAVDWSMKRLPVLINPG